MIIVKAPEKQDAEDAWSYSRNEKGEETLTHRRIGTIEELAGDAQAVVSGSEASFDLWGGGWLVKTVSLTPDSALASILTVVYTRGSTDSTGTGSDDENADGSEVADFQPIEKPVTTAPFWQNFGSEDTDKRAKMTKIVQMVIDAEDATVFSASESEEGLKKWLLDALGYVEEDDIEAIKKMSEKRMSGVEAYYYPAPTLSRTEVSDAAPSDFGAGVAKIETPSMKHVPVPDGFEWLGGGDRLTYDAAKKTFTRERSWIGADKWDRDFYSEK